MESFDYLTEYYTNMCDEDSRLASRHGQVEFLTTMRYIEKYLAPGAKILEIGAATGRYSHALARMGYDGTAVELVRHNLDILLSKTEPGEKITAIQGNALDLSFLPDETYDMTLLLGPMYHLYAVDEQKKAVSEALRVTKKGGVLYAAYCISDAAIIQHCFCNGHMFETVEKGLIDTETFKALSTPEEVFQLYRREDIDALMSGFHVLRLHYVAVDLFMNNFSLVRPAVEAMDDAAFDMYLKYHFFLCERPDFAGVTSHSLDIMRKL